jgi:hypothetical protein
VIRIGIENGSKITIPELRTFHAGEVGLVSFDSTAYSHYTVEHEDPGRNSRRLGIS